MVGVLNAIDSFSKFFHFTPQLFHLTLGARASETCRTGAASWMGSSLILNPLGIRHQKQQQQRRYHAS
jgi:hypothetical protein